MTPWRLGEKKRPGLTDVSSPVLIAFALAPPLAALPLEAAAAEPAQVAAPAAAAIAHAATPLRRFAREMIPLVFSWAPLFPAAYGVS